VLEVGEFEGQAWRTLAVQPLKGAEGSLPIPIDADLQRSILIVREQGAPSGL
jgi:hypothetical protein